MMNHAPRMGGADWALLVLLSLLWGGSFFFNGVALADVPVLTLVAARVALAAVVLGVLARARGVRLPVGVWPALLAMGLLNNVAPFCLIVWGQAQLGSGVAAILNATTPLFTALLAHGLTQDERLTRARVAGIVLGFAGVAVLTGGASGQMPALAAAACLGGALSYACASLWGRRFRTLGVPPLAAASGQLAASALVLAPLAAIADRFWTLPFPSAPVVASVLALALLSTALAYVVFFRLLASAGASNTSLVTLLIPPTAVALGAMFLGEAVLPRHLAGMALIGLGLILIDGRVLGRLGHQ